MTGLCLFASFPVACFLFALGLAMRLRIHAVHADDPHMRICASRCACKNLDAHQPHIAQKRVLQRQFYKFMWFDCWALWACCCWKRKWQDAVNYIRIVPQSKGKRDRKRRWKVKMADRKSCDQCPKTFASGGSLWNHKQTHNGVRRYNCSQCNKSSFEDPLPHSHWGETTRQEI